MDYAWLFLPVLSGVTCLAVFIWAMRGRATDGFEHCSHCDFNLAGRPADATRCPDCGLDLTKPASIRNDKRRVRTVWAFASGTALALLLLSGGSAAFVFLGSTDHFDLLPTSALSMVARGSDLNRQGYALAELLTRTSRRQISPGQLDGLVDGFLRQQVSSEFGTVPSSGIELIEALHSTNALDDGRWNTYLAQIPQLTVAPRARLRRGDALPMHVALSGRCNPAQPLLCQLALRVEAADGKLLAEKRWGQYWLPLDSTRAGEPYYLALDDTANFPLGKQRLVFKATLEIKRAATLMTSGTPGASAPPTTGSLLAAPTFDIPVEIDVVADPETSAAPVRDAATLAALRQGIQCGSIVTEPWRKSPIRQYSIPLTFPGRIPADLAFDVELSSGGKVLVRGKVDAYAGTRSFNPCVISPHFDENKKLVFLPPLPATVDVKLTPSPSWAAESVEMLTYADVELNFKAVPVVRVEDLKRDAPPAPTTEP